MRKEVFMCVVCLLWREKKRSCLKDKKKARIKGGVPKAEIGRAHV